MLKGSIERLPVLFGFSLTSDDGLGRTFNPTKEIKNCQTVGSQRSVGDGIHERRLINDSLTLLKAVLFISHSG